jgi:putative hemolysin
MTQILIEAGIIIILVLGNGLLAMAEMSLVSSRKPKLKALAAQGHTSAAKALLLVEAPNQFLSMVQIGITLVGILAGAFGGITIAEWLTLRFREFGLSLPYAESAGVAVVVVAITFLSLIFGELVPKRLALSAPERFACLVAGPMRRFSALARPAVQLLGWFTDMVLRALGVKPEASAQVTAEEVGVLMQEGQMAGIFHPAEPRMVERVLQLDELLVKEIMTPRPKVVFVNRDENHGQAWPKMVASGHSSFPVYQGNRDHIVGVLSVKALYASLASGAPVVISGLMREPLFAPATQSVAQLLESFRESQNHFAIVADEFGGIVGVATLVDVLEAIVGDVPSPENRGEAAIRRREDGTWLVDASIEIERMEESLPGLRFENGSDRGYETLAGYLLKRLSRIPEEGETLTALGWRFEIIDMDGPRIDKVLLRPEVTR